MMRKARMRALRLRLKFPSGPLFPSYPLYPLYPSDPPPYRYLNSLAAASNSPRNSGAATAISASTR